MLDCSEKHLKNLMRLKEKMDSIGTKLTDFLFIQQTEPVAKVLAKEPYMFPGQIRKKN